MFQTILEQQHQFLLVSNLVERTSEQDVVQKIQDGMPHIPIYPKQTRVYPETGLVTGKVVTFYSVADADAGLTSMACKTWHERPMRMMHYEPDDAKRETGVGNLFVQKHP